MIFFYTLLGLDKDRFRESRPMTPLSKSVNESTEQMKSKRQIKHRTSDSASNNFK